MVNIKVDYFYCTAKPILIHPLPGGELRGGGLVGIERMLETIKVNLGKPKGAKPEGPKGIGQLCCRNKRYNRQYGLSLFLNEIGNRLCLYKKVGKYEFISWPNR